MKLIKLGLSTAVTFLAVTSFSANAEDCSWQLSGFSSTPSTNTITVRHACVQNTTVLAAKSAVVKAKGNPQCSIAIANGYKNISSCVSPEIVLSNSCAGTHNAGYVYMTFDARSGSSWPLSQASKYCSSCSGEVIPHSSDPAQYKAACK